MTDSPTLKRLLGHLVSALIFGALACAALSLHFVRMATPPVHIQDEAGDAIPREKVFKALSPESVCRTFGEISAFGSRAPGQPGLAKTRDYLLGRFRSLGLDIYTQDVDIAYPLLAEGSGFVSNATFRAAVWPLSPNYAQPVTTGPDGVEGKLFIADTASMRSSRDFSGRIAVIDVGGDVFGDYGLNPARYVDVGFKAVIYTHHDGLEAVDWETISRFVILQKLPANIVRVACGPEILDHVGDVVRIDAVSTWRNARTQNVVAVLRAPSSSGRALFVPVLYDAGSILPDCAAGSLEVFQTAMLVQTAEAFAAVRDNLRRDVIFVAMTGLSQNHAGANRLLSTIGFIDRRSQPAIRLAEDIAQNESRLAKIEEISVMLKGVFDQQADNSNRAAELSAAMRTLPKPTQKFLAERFSASMRDLVFRQAENLLQARIAYQRHPDDLDSADYHRFRREKGIYDRLNSISGIPFAKAVQRFKEVEAFGIDPLANFKASIERLRDYHLDRRAMLEADSALIDLFANYTDICAISPRFSPLPDDGVEKLGASLGRDMPVSSETYSIFKTMTDESVLSLGLSGALEVAEAEWAGFSQFFTAELDSLPFCAASFPALSIVTATKSKHRSLHPFAQTEFANPACMPANSMKVYADVAASMAETTIPFPRLPTRGGFNVHGKVFASGVGSSAIPNYAVANAFVCSTDRKQPLFTNPYGEYDIPFGVIPAMNWERWFRYDAFLFDNLGRIIYAKDYGQSAQSLYASNHMPGNYQPLNHILYRATPVVMLDTVNPQSLKAFTSFAFIGAKGLGAFSSTCPFAMPDGFMNFLPPDARFFVTLKAGAPENELVAVTREFLLGTTATNSPAWKPSGNEIEGPGYLAADTPFLRGIASEAVASMTWLTDKRLDLQRRYGIADELTEAFAAKAAKASVAELAPATQDGATAPAALSRLRRMREALSYLILNHPVVRGAIAEAVFGIIWYLGLLVPFAFFFEKLVFGFTDVRKQLLAQGAIFLVVFLLLRLLHPAFHMIRSSAMVLLGFVIIIIVGSVMALLSGKFKENIDALRRSQGHVAGAEGNKSGIILTAFMLGLNNMHRRRVRTGLTCATLVLMTFVMVCFTSVQTSIVDSERAIGRAPYQGIVVRDKEFMPISLAEVDALKSEFGEHYTVSRRTMYTGWFDGNKQTLRSPTLKVSVGTGDSSRLRMARAALGFDPTEPLAGSIRLLCTNGWLTAFDVQSTAPRPVIIPELMASQLGVTPQMVEQGTVPVTINGVPFYVQNIFDASSLAALTDADGHDLLPFDVESLTSTRFAPGNIVIANDTAMRVAVDEIILIPNDSLSIDRRGMRTSSAVIDMGGAPYQTARAEIVSYMERSGRQCHYALDGTAFVGQRARSRSATGFLELLIPLIIAALTVLNTMKGSVYERQGEIYVYNAVGIAPRYIFFIFIAESLVYAVVGSVLGYVFSLGAGRLVTLFGPTGMGMNFTSATCVYASLAIAAATLLSTWYPARTAMRIAKPADNAGWTLPKPDADGRLSILLPFTFTHYDRIAVLAFFHRYFEGFGEGGAGLFFAAEPELKLSDHTDPLADGAYIPELSVRVWLKPFDLGVSQQLEIELATDPDTHEYIAKMILTRLTGTLDAWLRLNGPFVAAIRRRFLHWRAISPEQKDELFADAKTELARNYRASF